MVGVSEKEPSKKVANQYERNYDYTKYWDNRDYENAAEHIAIRRLLKGNHFRKAADIGGGFGRLCILLRTFSDEVTLAEPAATQLEAAKKVLEGTDIKQVQMQADDLKFEDGELDLITMVRVMHHLPDPTAEFAEISRVLAPGGTAIIEVANYGHFKNRRRHKKEGTPLPTEPVNIRKTKADEPDAIAFVNHNIDTVVGSARRGRPRAREQALGVQPAQPDASSGPCRPARCWPPSASRSAGWRAATSGRASSSSSASPDSSVEVE